jgi:hypothetical protein
MRSRRVGGDWTTGRLGPCHVTSQPILAGHQLEQLEAARAPYLRELRTRYLDAATADGTGGDRSTAVRWWVKFCTLGRGMSPIMRVDQWTPIADKLRNEMIMMDFGLWLVAVRGVRPDTARKYAGTVNTWHERKYGNFVAGDLRTSRLAGMFKGMRRLIDVPPKRRRWGVRTQDLARAMRVHLPKGTPWGTRRRRSNANWRALLSTGFVGLLRGAECTVPDGVAPDWTQHLTRADVSFRVVPGVGRCVVLMIRPVKNRKILRGKHVELVLAPGGTLVDAVEELIALFDDDGVQKADWATTPLFRNEDGSPIRTSQLRGMVKYLMGCLGLSEALFGAHSLRIGGATAALQAGVSPSLIRLLGRWSSDVYEIYTRLCLGVALDATRRVGSTPFEDLERGFQTEELEAMAHEFDG